MKPDSPLGAESIIPLSLTLAREPPQGRSGHTRLTRGPGGDILCSVAKILVVDDEPALALLVAECLKTGGHEPVICHDPTAAVALALKEKPELAIIDYQMPGKTGVQLLSDLRAREETRLLPVLFLSGTETVRYAGQVPPEPRVRFLRKPVERAVLLASAAEMLDPDSWTHAS